MKKNKKAPSWTVTFSDLLSLLITMFVTIYALADHHKKPKSADQPSESKPLTETEEPQKSTQIIQPAEEIDTSFSDYTIANILAKLKTNVTVLQKPHSIIIKISKDNIFSEQGQLNETGKFILGSIPQAWKANPPSSVEVVFNEDTTDNSNALRKACTVADFMLNFVEEVDAIKCTTGYEHGSPQEIKITLIE